MRNALTSRIVLAAAVGLAAMSPGPSTATPVDPEILRSIESKAAAAPKLTKKQLIEKGRVLFSNETFEGNGRTCGTCHPVTNNFTIDPAFIATLPDDDPLFVHEFNPDLKELESARLLRKFGVFRENLDGFHRPAVMRSVPHNLGMPMSIRPDPANPLAGPEGNRVHALGWSGDGSPGTGSLREFAIGAIVQHLPKTLARKPGVDFRLPTAEELDALEAYMRSVGRRKDVDFAAMTFTDARVARGKRLFNNEDEVDDRSCSACHANGGANDGDGFNRNFDTGTRLLTATAWGGTDAPPDGGLGTEHQGGVRGFGDGTMNSPSLIEAADTAPFFHNNSKQTLEEAIGFYATDEFAAGDRGLFQFTPEDIDAVGALLRVLNAMENIRSSNAMAQEAQRLTGAAATQRIEEAMAETEDAIEVLRDGPLVLHPGVVGQLQRALAAEQEALETASRSRRNALLREASQIKNSLSSRMVVSRQ
jgi:cytochrome c peroxidase